MAAYSGILAWKIPCPGVSWLQSFGSPRVRHDFSEWTTSKWYWFFSFLPVTFDLGFCCSGSNARKREVSLLWRVGFRFLYCFLYLLSSHPSILMFLLHTSVCRLLVMSIHKLFMNFGHILTFSLNTAGLSFSLVWSVKSVSNVYPHVFYLVEFCSCCVCCRFFFCSLCPCGQILFRFFHCHFSCIFELLCDKLLSPPSLTGNPVQTFFY